MKLVYRVVIPKGKLNNQKNEIAKVFLVGGVTSRTCFEDIIKQISEALKNSSRIMDEPKIILLDPSTKFDSTQPRIDLLVYTIED